MLSDRVLVVAGNAPEGVAELEPLRDALQGFHERTDVLAQAEIEARFAVAADSQPAPQLVTVLPSVEGALRLARKLHLAWPESHLLMVRHEAEIGAFRRSLGMAPMLGRHWSLVESDQRALGPALRQALASSRQRRQLRTALDKANARLTQTRANATSEYQRLVASEHHLWNFLRHSRDAVVGLDKDGLVLFWSEGAAQLLGTSAKDALGRPIARVTAWSAELQRALDLLDAARPTQTVEDWLLLHGREIALEAILSITLDQRGHRLGTSMVLREVTARRRAQEQLRDTNLSLQQLVSERSEELEKSQSALVQAQKLEAIGKLTGGVAHDFNNVLQIIGSNLQLLQTTVQLPPDANRLVSAALNGVDRGGKLSSQLLAFARRQPLRPVSLNLSRHVREMEELLRRALGEHIEIRTVLDSDVWTALADANQLGNVLLNLAINSRDAMPGGGKLTIETANAELDESYTRSMADLGPGQYVVLAVSDTGHGMPAEVAARAFEPFFTTKPEGQGTGLGLSMAYGFAKQSGGHIRIYSEPGAGTTIRLYLPRSHEKESEPAAPLSGPVAGGTETILVVEDDTALQEAVVGNLQQLGYRVLRASHAQEALAVMQSGATIDLLFTDVVMPGPLAGADLVRHARRLDPGIAVLFTSGYTQNALVHGGRLDPEIDLLSKPYRHEDLARKIRHVLGKQQRVKALTAVADCSGRVTHASPAAASAGRAASLRVLLVDDQQDVRDTTQQLLEFLGCEVRAVPSAEAAGMVLKSLPFDVVLTDVDLPGRNGVQLAQEAGHLQAGIKVVLSSGYARAFVDSVLPAGLSAWNLPKPYGLPELQALLSELMAPPPASGLLPGI